jgi:LmbE family N-acetylglucosaminyl deacetylase
LILVVSPHLDDAALSCADHALRWQAAGHVVHVLTLFSAAGPWPSPLLGLTPGDVAAAEALMARRRAEDHQALHRLGFACEHLGLIDAGFRGDTTPHFQSLAHLLSGSCGPGGQQLVHQAAHLLRERVAAATGVLAPLGVGGHVDHVITRLACEAAAPAHALVYYADMPYARAPWRWTAPLLRQALTWRRSWHWISPRKRQALAAYASQMPALFRRPPHFPELLLWPRNQPGFDVASSAVGGSGCGALGLAEVPELDFINANTAWPCPPALNASTTAFRTFSTCCDAGMRPA